MECSQAGKASPFEGDIVGSSPAIPISTNNKGLSIMANVRGGLKKGFYISSKKEKIYISEIKNNVIIYGGKGGKSAHKFSDNDSAYTYLDLYNLRKTHKVVEVR